MNALYVSILAFALAAPVAAQTTNDSATVKASAPEGKVPGHAIPRIVQEWEAAWNTGDGNRMAALFTTDGGYQDFSLGYRFTGGTAISKFVQESVKNVGDLHVSVTDAFRTNDRIALRFVFSGHVNGAPKAFSVPVLTVMELKGDKITYDGDYYNRLEFLKQSGLPTS